MKIFYSRLILTCSMLAGAVNVHAGSSTAEFMVRVTVEEGSVCGISASNIEFGSYTGDQINRTANITATCPQGMGYRITIGPGVQGNFLNNRRLQLEGATGTGDAENLQYDLYGTPGNDIFRTVWGVENNNGIPSEIRSYTGTGADQNITVYGSVHPGNRLARPGTYRDTVTVSLLL